MSEEPRDRWMPTAFFKSVDRRTLKDILAEWLLRASSASASGIHDCRVSFQVLFS